MLDRDAAFARVEKALRSVPDAEELRSMHGMLRQIKSAFDDGRKVSIPYGDRSKALKASWHADGSWPLIGYDEAQRHSICNPALCVVSKMHVSRHKHADIVQNEAYERGKREHRILPCTQAPPPPLIVEPDADSIAEAYAMRQREQNRMR